MKIPHAIPRRLQVLPLVALLATLGVLLTGCDDEVNPFVESERFFTVFGALDMQADTQFVRVTPIDQVLIDTIEAPLAVTVRSEDLMTGVEHVWRDSVIRFEDGSIGHIFYTPLRVQPGHRYRFEVIRDGDAATTAAETTVPALPEATLENVRITGNLVRQAINWQGIQQEPVRIRTVYRFQESNASFKDIAVLYETSATSTQIDLIDGVLRVDVDYSGDKSDVLEEINLALNPIFLGVAQEVTVLDEDYVPPGGTFDPDVLVQPGVFSNVENGFGFLGAVGRFSTEWVLPKSAADALNYTLPITRGAVTDTPPVQISALPLR